MKMVIFYILLLFVCNDVFSGTVNSKILFIQVNNGTSWPGLVAVKFDAMPNSQPSCATDNQGRFGFSIDTDAGKATYALMLSAQASGKTVEVYGKNSCFGSTAIEEIDYVRIKS